MVLFEKKIWGFYAIKRNFGWQKYFGTFWGGKKIFWHFQTNKKIFCPKLLPPFEKESTLCVWSQITPVPCITRSWNFTWIIFNPFLNTPQNFMLLLPGIFEKWAKTFALSRLKLVRNWRKWANSLIRNCKKWYALTPKCMKIPHKWTFFFKRRKYIL